MLNLPITLRPILGLDRDRVSVDYMSVVWWLHSRNGGKKWAHRKKKKRKNALYVMATTWITPCNGVVTKFCTAAMHQTTAAPHKRSKAFLFSVFLVLQFGMTVLSISLGSKIRLMHYLVTSILLYACESLDHHSIVSKRNTSHGNEVLQQETTHLKDHVSYQQGSPF